MLEHSTFDISDMREIIVCSAAVYVSYSHLTDFAQYVEGGTGEFSMHSGE